MNSRFFQAGVTMTLLAGLGAGLAWGGPLRDKLQEQRNARRADSLELADESRSLLPAGQLPPGARAIRNLAYGSTPRQSMDVYLPASAASAAGAPVILMVHGGAWKFGDKGASAVLEHKLQRWLPLGFVFISINYRLLPAAAPWQQAQDVAAGARRGAGAGGGASQGG